MTKADLANAVAENSESTKAEAELVVEIVLESIIESLNSGENAELRGFGSFRLRQRRPRQARNPKTGEKVQVPAKRVAYFKPGLAARGGST